MSLKDLTWENHKKAERKDFAALLMSGTITPQVYYRYLLNQFTMYAALEQKINFEELGIDGIQRASKIFYDMFELQKLHNVYSDDELMCPVTKDYVEYISTKTQEQLIPHIYVRHFGDMFGGAMIAKKIPGSGSMYEFDNKNELIENTRALLNNDMADEANKCFEFAIRLFDEVLT